MHRRYDNRGIWLCAALLAILGVFVLLVDWSERIKPVPMVLLGATVLVMLPLWFIDDSQSPESFVPVRDVVRIGWSLLVMAGAFALAIILGVRLIISGVPSDSPQETAHIVQAILSLFISGVAAFALWIQLRWIFFSVQQEVFHSDDQVVHEQQQSNVVVEEKKKKPPPSLLQEHQPRGAEAPMAWHTSTDLTMM